MVSPFFFVRGFGVWTVAGVLERLFARTSFESVSTGWGAAYSWFLVWETLIILLTALGSGGFIFSPQMSESALDGSSSTISIGWLEGIYSAYLWIWFGSCSLIDYTDILSVWRTKFFVWETYSTHCLTLIEFLAVSKGAIISWSSSLSSLLPPEDISMTLSSPMGISKLLAKTTGSSSTPDPSSGWELSISRELIFCLRGAFAPICFFWGCENLGDILISTSTSIYLGSSAGESSSKCWASSPWSCLHLYASVELDIYIWYTMFLLIWCDFWFFNFN